MKYFSILAVILALSSSAYSGPFSSFMSRLTDCNFNWKDNSSFQKEKIAKAREVILSMDEGQASDDILSEAFAALYFIDDIAAIEKISDEFMLLGKKLPQEKKWQDMYQTSFEKFYRRGFEVYRRAKNEAEQVAAFKVIDDLTPYSWKMHYKTSSQKIFQSKQTSLNLLKAFEQDIKNVTLIDFRQSPERRAEFLQSLTDMLVYLSYATENQTHQSAFYYKKVVDVMRNIAKKEVTSTPDIIVREHLKEAMKEMDKMLRIENTEFIAAKRAKAVEQHGIDEQKMLEVFEIGYFRTNAKGEQVLTKITPDKYQEALEGLSKVLNEEFELMRATVNYTRSTSNRIDSMVANFFKEGTPGYYSEMTNVTRASAKRALHYFQSGDQQLVKEAHYLVNIIEDSYGPMSRYNPKENSSSL